MFFFLGTKLIRGTSSHIAQSKALRTAGCLYNASGIDIDEPESARKFLPVVGAFRESRVCSVSDCWILLLRILMSRLGNMCLEVIHFVLVVSRVG
jgi:hypothetical protein